jgi:hypothetical protein
MEAPEQPVVIVYPVKRRVGERRVDGLWQLVFDEVVARSPSVS